MTRTSSSCRRFRKFNIPTERQTSRSLRVRSSMAEHSAVNRRVVGSSPSVPAISKYCPATSRITDLPTPLLASVPGGHAKHVFAFIEASSNSKTRPFEGCNPGAAPGASTSGDVRLPTCRGAIEVATIHGGPVEQNLRSISTASLTARHAALTRELSGRIRRRLPRRYGLTVE